jgi:diacylglycerol O-acyltransferase-1
MYSILCWIEDLSGAIEECGLESEICFVNAIHLCCQTRIMFLCRLNIVAELMCFGDREFYKDWWNAKTVEEYWRMWNMPVHKWMVRHIYFPCLRVGLSKRAAVVVVFAISGIFHEVCIGVPCHMLRCWAFLGIMLQVPLVFLTNYLHKRFHNSMVGNMVFWFFFCIVGQPMCLLLYYHDVVNDFQTMSSSEKH